MLTTLVLTTALLAPAAPLPRAPANAPAPKEATPATASGGQPPRIVEIKPDKDGKVLISVMRPQKMQGGGGFGGIGGAPGGNPAPAIRAIMINRPQNVELTDVKDLKITTAAGKEVSKDDAIKALAKGGQVVVSADGKSVSPAFLKMFKDEVLVLVSPELVVGNGAFGNVIQGGAIWVNPAGPGPRAAPRLVPQPAPAPKQN